MQMAHRSVGVMERTQATPRRETPPKDGEALAVIPSPSFSGSRSLCEEDQQDVTAPPTLLRAMEQSRARRWQIRKSVNFKGDGGVRGEKSSFRRRWEEIKQVHWVAFVSHLSLSRPVILPQS